MCLYAEIRTKHQVMRTVFVKFKTFTSFKREHLACCYASYASCLACSVFLRLFMYDVGLGHDKFELIYLPTVHWET